MKLINSGEDSNESERLIFENVDVFKCLDATLSTKNDCAKEINIRLNEAEKTSYALAKFLNSTTLSKRIKTRLYVAIIRPTLT